MNAFSPSPWYFACHQCNAKMFAAKPVTNCRRCGKRLVSDERSQPRSCESQSQPHPGVSLHSPSPPAAADAALLRTLAHALRHKPQSYFLEMDSDGWVDMNHLLLALRHQHANWSALTSSDLQRIVEAGPYPRFEIRNRRMRALYGHSINVISVPTPDIPPGKLYHGTCQTLLDSIREIGLQPMGRRYVHLSTSWNYSKNVASSKASRPVVLTIRAKAAATAGITFWKSCNHVWLVNSLSPEFILRTTL